ncbi:MAG TPA: peptide chain release factor N(5)-glutamine methyltransferase [Actinomycetota bacterium]|nr:peptide chain release factor N(5)-glutamine methyltransferase [Actinomycetota bacterium]
MQTLARLLERHGIESPDAEARWIVETSSGIARSQLTLPQTVIDEEAAHRSLSLGKRRAAGEPLQYVTGTVGFRRIELAVGPGVFIPRPETEVVVEAASRRLGAGGTIVDIGTGSGAIALSLADERPDAKVYATERSAEAIAWCRKNLAALRLNVEVFEGDLFMPLPSSLRRAVDVVVSNPPYVAQGELSKLAQEIVAYEPHEALFAGDGGLSMIRRIAEEARSWLKPAGWLVMEIGETQGAAARQLLRELGYADVTIHKDLPGRDRVAEGQWPNNI